MKQKNGRARRSLCKKGLHPMTPDNTYEHPSKGPECRECKRSYMREYMREVRAAAGRR
jgi:hypothetical protein